MPSYLCSLLTADLDFATAIGADSRSFIERAMNSSGGVGHLNLLNRITYAYITPIIIAFGVFGSCYMVRHDSSMVV
ncbi:hypothetical protein AB6A40_001368 [Gnathostoma spinigerum]|uniref:Uncharacterized protein n=1 Tax=Gnathostoma spinigerum TaxID=75299 RepID=A0ABD6EBD4_9BILA